MLPIVMPSAACMGRWGISRYLGNGLAVGTGI